MIFRGVGLIRCSDSARLGPVNFPPDEPLLDAAVLTTDYLKMTFSILINKHVISMSFIGTILYLDISFDKALNSTY